MTRGGLNVGFRPLPQTTRDGEADVVLPALIVDAGPDAVQRFLEFFAGRIANERTRAAYGRAAGAIPRVVRGARPRPGWLRLHEKGGKRHDVRPTTGPPRPSMPTSEFCGLEDGWGRG